MAHMDMVNRKLITLIREQLGVEASDVTSTSDFVEDLEADSLDRIELMMACEETFGIEIPDADAEAIRTVGQLQIYIDRRLAATA